MSLLNKSTNAFYFLHLKTAKAFVLCYYFMEVICIIFLTSSVFTFYGMGFIFLSFLS